MRVGIYARVPTETQEARGTIGSLEALRAKVAADGDELVAEFAGDGYCGARLDRPGLDPLRDAAEAGRIEARWSDLRVHQPSGSGRVGNTHAARGAPDVIERLILAFATQPGHPKVRAPASIFTAVSQSQAQPASAGNTCTAILIPGAARGAHPDLYRCTRAPRTVRSARGNSRAASRLPGCTQS